MMMLWIMMMMMMMMMTLPSIVGGFHQHHCPFGYTGCHRRTRSRCCSNYNKKITTSSMIIPSSVLLLYRKDPSFIKRQSLMFSKTESLSSDDDDNDTNTNTNNEDVLKPPLQLSMEDLDIDMDELSHLLLQQTDDDDKEASVTSTTRRTTKSTELWLDLRGTAIYPKAAVDYLMEELLNGDDDDAEETICSDKLTTIIDRVLVSDTMFQTILNKQKKQEEQKGYLLEGEKRRHPDPSLLYIPDENLDMLVESRNDMSFPIGTIRKLPTGGERSSASSIDDPISAMDDVSRGQWIVLVNEDNDNGGGGDDENMPRVVSAVSGFLDIVSAAATMTMSATSSDSLILGSLPSSISLDRFDDIDIDSSSSSSSDNNLLLIPKSTTNDDGSGGANDNQNDINTSIGGVAIRCNSKSFVVQIATIIQQLQSNSNSKRMTTTESGILIHSTAANDDSDDDTLTSAPSIKTALLLPFDLSIWNTALLLVGDDNYNMYSF